MKNRYKVAVLTVFFLAISCGSEDKSTAVDNTTPVVVKVSAVQSNGNTLFITASGKIQAKNSVELSTRMMGFVNKVHVHVGDKVTKGQMLVSINNTDLQAKRAQANASITEATAAFNNAQKDYNRFKNLFADRSASQKELDDMTANYEMAKARLEAANQMKNEVNAQFKYSNITAPFSGVVTRKNIEVGAMVNPGMPLISIETPGSFEVIAMVPESEILQIKDDTQVDVIVKSIDEVVKGKVIEISTSSQNTGGQYLVKIALDKTDINILSGMFATVQFPVDKKVNKTSMVLIPQSAIIENGSLKGIYTVSLQNTALLRWLRLGKTYGDNIEVLSGLNADEHYIISAESKLMNGTKVSIQ